MSRFGARRSRARAASCRPRARRYRWGALALLLLADRVGGVLADAAAEGVTALLVRVLRAERVLVLLALAAARLDRLAHVLAHAAAERATAVLVRVLLLERVPVGLALGLAGRLGLCDAAVGVGRRRRQRHQRHRDERRELAHVCPPALGGLTELAV